MIHKRKSAVLFWNISLTFDATLLNHTTLLFVMPCFFSVTSCLTFKPHKALSPVFLRVTGWFDDLRVSMVSSSSIYITSSHLVPDILWRWRRLALVCGRNLTRHAGAARWLVGLRHFNRVLWRDGAADGGQHWCHEHNKHHAAILITYAKVSGLINISVYVDTLTQLCSLSFVWKVCVSCLNMTVSSAQSSFVKKQFSQFKVEELKLINISVRPHWHWSNLSVIL